MSEIETHTETGLKTVTELPDTWSGEMSALMRLGVPMAFTQLVQFSIYFADMVMVARLSPLDISAIGIGYFAVFFLWMLASGPAIAVSPMASQALGANANEVKDIRRSVRMALWCITIMTPIIFITMLLVEPAALKLGQNAEASERAKSYALAVGIGLPFTLATLVLRNFLAAINKTLIPFFIITLVVIINIGLNALLIFGHWGFPRLELVGAGLASSISAFIGFCLFVLYIGWDKRARTFEIFKNFAQPDWERFGEVVRLGWPISITMMFEGMLFNAGLLVVGVIGVIEQAAYQIALNVASVAFMLPYGMSMAGAVRIGLARGARNAGAERRAAGATILASVIAIGIVAIPMAVVPEFISSLYLDHQKVDNQQVIAFVLMFLPVAAAFAFFDAVQVACNQLLRGLKDVQATMIISGISYWVIGFPAMLYMGLKTDLQATGVWYGLLIALIAASIFLGIRLAQLLWRDQHQMVPHP